MLGGEPSGHIVFRKVANTGDGILTALRVAEIVLKRKSPLSCLLRGYTPFPQRRRDVPCANAAQLLENEGVRRAIARAEDVAGGRVVVRPSGTEPVLRILAEGTDEGAASEAVTLIERAVLSAKEAL